jgi:hypothetical protein
MLENTLYANRHFSCRIKFALSEGSGQRFEPCQARHIVRALNLIMPSRNHPMLKKKLPRPLGPAICAGDGADL